MSRKEVDSGVDVRLKEHRSDVKCHRTSSAIVQNIEDTIIYLLGMKPNFSKECKKTNKEALETAHIITRNTFNSRRRFVICSSAAEKLAAVS